MQAKYPDAFLLPLLLPIFLIGLFPLLVLGVSSGNSFTSRFLSWGPIHYLGSISYSIYLLHMPWYYFGYLHAGLFGMVPAVKLSSTLVLVGGLFAIAAFSYHAVEVPVRRMIRGALQTRAASRPRERPPLAFARRRGTCQTPRCAMRLRKLASLE